jgi:hypothetical protein
MPPGREIQIRAHILLICGFCSRYITFPQEKEKTNYEKLLFG